MKETEVMIPGLLQQSVATHKVKVTPEMVRETSEFLGIDFSKFERYKTNRNSKDGDKVPNTSMQ